jgi:parallel beta-helix repeat protein
VEVPKVWATLNGPQLHTSASPTIGDLQSFYASANTILYLSSGTGGAYGTSAGGPALSSATELIVIGSGYGQAMTDGGYSAVAATPQTALETSDSAAFLFSAGADLLLANLRLTGGDVGVKASTAAPLDLFVVDCLFTDQDEWAVYVEDTGGAADDVTVNLYGSMIDASATTGTDHGGIYLEEVEYDVFDSLVKGSHLPSGIGGGVYAESGGGIIDSNVFFENAPAIWISDSSPTISYNIINGNAATDTRGINITTSGDPLLQFNQIKENKEYGVRIEGGTIPTLYRNIIEKNEESGIVFDGSFTGAVMPNLGNIVSSPPSNGQNIFLDNTNSTWADGGNIFVTNISTSVGLPITAENNWWDNLGQGFEPAIRLTIRDGVDWGGGQPIIDINPASPTKPN